MAAAMNIIHISAGPADGKGERIREDTTISQGHKKCCKSHFKVQKAMGEARTSKQVGSWPWRKASKMKV